MAPNNNVYDERDFYDEIDMHPTAYMIDSLRCDRGMNDLEGFSFFYFYFYCDADQLNPKYVRNNWRDNNLYRYWSIDENDHITEYHINYQV